MDMNRRAFLGSLAALTAGMALDPERALWVPGRKTYFDIQRPDLRKLHVVGLGCLPHGSLVTVGNRMYRLERISDDEATIEVARDEWPFMPGVTVVGAEFAGLVLNAAGEAGVRLQETCVLMPDLESLKIDRSYFRA